MDYKQEYNEESWAADAQEVRKYEENTRFAPDYQAALEHAQAKILEYENEFTKQITIRLNNSKKRMGEISNQVEKQLQESGIKNPARQKNPILKTNQEYQAALNEYNQAQHLLQTVAPQVQKIHDLRQKQSNAQKRLNDQTSYTEEFGRSYGISPQSVQDMLFLDPRENTYNQVIKDLGQLNKELDVEIRELSKMDEQYDTILKKCQEQEKNLQEASKKKEEIDAIRKRMWEYRKDHLTQLPSIQVGQQANEEPNIQKKAIKKNASKGGKVKYPTPRSIERQEQEQDEQIKKLIEQIENKQPIDFTSLPVSLDKSNGQHTYKFLKKDFRTGKWVDNEALQKAFEKAGGTVLSTTGTTGPFKDKVYTDSDENKAYLTKRGNIGSENHQISDLVSKKIIDPNKLDEAEEIILGLLKKKDTSVDDLQSLVDENDDQKTRMHVRRALANRQVFQNNVDRAIGDTPITSTEHSRGVVYSKDGKLILQAGTTDVETAKSNIDSKYTSSFDKGYNIIQTLMNVFLRRMETVEENQQQLKQLNDQLEDYKKNKIEIETPNFQKQQNTIKNLDVKIRDLEVLIADVEKAKIAIEDIEDETDKNTKSTAIQDQLDNLNDELKKAQDSKKKLETKQFINKQRELKQLEYNIASTEKAKEEIEGVGSRSYVVQVPPRRYKDESNPNNDMPDISKDVIHQFDINATLDELKSLVSEIHEILDESDETKQRQLGQAFIKKLTEGTDSHGPYIKRTTFSDPMSEMLPFMTEDGKLIYTNALKIGDTPIDKAKAYPRTLFSAFKGAADYKDNVPRSDEITPYMITKSLLGLDPEKQKAFFNSLYAHKVYSDDDRKGGISIDEFTFGDVNTEGTTDTLKNVIYTTQKDLLLKALDKDGNLVDANPLEASIIAHDFLPEGAERGDEILSTIEINGHNINDYILMYKEAKKNQDEKTLTAIENFLITILDSLFSTAPDSEEYAFGQRLLARLSNVERSEYSSVLTREEAEALLDKNADPKFVHRYDVRDEDLSNKIFDHRRGQLAFGEEIQKLEDPTYDPIHDRGSWEIELEKQKTQRMEQPSRDNEDIMGEVMYDADHDNLLRFTTLTVAGMGNSILNTQGKINSAFSGFKDEKGELNARDLAIATMYEDDPEYLMQYFDSENVNKIYNAREGAQERREIWKNISSDLYTKTDNDFKAYDEDTFLRRRDLRNVFTDVDGKADYQAYKEYVESGLQELDKMRPDVKADVEAFINALKADYYDHGKNYGPEIENFVSDTTAYFKDDILKEKFLNNWVTLTKTKAKAPSVVENLQRHQGARKWGKENTEDFDYPEAVQKEIDRVISSKLVKESDLADEDIYQASTGEELPESDIQTEIDILRYRLFGDKNSFDIFKNMGLDIDVGGDIAEHMLEGTTTYQPEGGDPKKVTILSLAESYVKKFKEWSEMLNNDGQKLSRFDYRTHKGLPVGEAEEKEYQEYSTKFDTLDQEASDLRANLEKIIEEQLGLPDSLSTAESKNINNAITSLTDIFINTVQEIVDLKEEAKRQKPKAAVVEDAKNKIWDSVEESQRLLAAAEEYKKSNNVEAKKDDLDLKGVDNPVNKAKRQKLAIENEIKAVNNDEQFIKDKADKAYEQAKNIRDAANKIIKAKINKALQLFLERTARADAILDKMQEAYDSAEQELESAKQEYDLLSSQLENGKYKNKSVKKQQNFYKKYQAAKDRYEHASKKFNSASKDLEKRKAINAQVRTRARAKYIWPAGKTITSIRMNSGQEAGQIVYAAVNERDADLDNIRLKKDELSGKLFRAENDLAKEIAKQRQTAIDNVTQTKFTSKAIKERREMVPYIPYDTADEFSKQSRTAIDRFRMAFSAPYMIDVDRFAQTQKSPAASVLDKTNKAEEAPVEETPAGSPEANGNNGVVNTIVNQNIPLAPPSAPQLITKKAPTKPRGSRQSKKSATNTPNNNVSFPTGPYPVNVLGTDDFDTTDYKSTSISLDANGKLISRTLQLQEDITREQTVQAEILNEVKAIHQNTEDISKNGVAVGGNTQSSGFTSSSNTTWMGGEFAEYRKAKFGLQTVYHELSKLPSSKYRTTEEILYANNLGNLNKQYEKTINEITQSHSNEPDIIQGYDDSLQLPLAISDGKFSVSQEDKKITQYRTAQLKLAKAEQEQKALNGMIEFDRSKGQSDLLTSLTEQVNLLTKARDSINGLKQSVKMSIQDEVEILLQIQNARIAIREEEKAAKERQAQEEQFKKEYTAKQKELMTLNSQAIKNSTYAKKYGLDIAENPQSSIEKQISDEQKLIVSRMEALSTELETMRTNNPQLQSFFEERQNEMKFENAGAQKVEEQAKFNKELQQTYEEYKKYLEILIEIDKITRQLNDTSLTDEQKTAYAKLRDTVYQPQADAYKQLYGEVGAWKTPYEKERYEAADRDYNERLLRNQVQYGSSKYGGTSSVKSLNKQDAGYVKEYQKNVDLITKLIAKNEKLEKDMATTPSMLGKGKTAMQQQIAENNLEIEQLQQQNDALRAKHQNILATADAIDKTAEKQRKLNSLANQARKGGAQNIWDVITGGVKQTITRMFDYNGVYRILNKITQSFTKVINLSKELDTTLFNLRVVTGNTKTETSALIKQYNQLGKTLGATTTQVASAANEWLRQGYEAAEANELITASTYLSKLGMIDSAQATQYLTSMMKGFKMEATDAVDIVSKLTAVDMQAAVSSGGLAEALSQVATTAQLAGVDLDTVVGYAATIIETTQQDESSVGRAMRTIISRYGNVKAGAYTKMNLESNTDTDLDNLNDIEKVLKKIGISIRESVTEFRDFDDVIDELGEKWTTLDNVSKNAIATAMAGVRQREDFLVMMENLDRASQLTQISAESSGTAEQKYAAYMETIESATNRLANAWEELALKLEESGIVKFITDIATDLVKFLLPAIQAIGAALVNYNFFKLPTLFSNMLPKVKGLFNFKESRAKWLQQHQSNADSSSNSANTAAIESADKAFVSMTETANTTAKALNNLASVANTASQATGGETEETVRLQEQIQNDNKAIENNKRDFIANSEALKKNTSTQTGGTPNTSNLGSGIATKLKSNAGGAIAGGLLSGVMGGMSADGSTGNKVVSGVVQGALTAGLGAAFGPMGAMIGSTIGSFVGPLLGDLVDKEETDMQERSEQAQAMLAQLESQKEAITELGTTTLKVSLDGTDIESIKATVAGIYETDSIDEDEGEQNVFHDAFVKVMKGNTTLFNGAKEEDIYQNLEYWLTNGTSQQRAALGQYIELAQITAEKEQYEKSQEAAIAHGLSTADATARNYKLNNYAVDTAYLKSGVSQLSSSELMRLGISGVIEKVTESVDVSDLNGDLDTTSSEFKNMIKTLMKTDTAMENLLAGTTYTLNEVLKNSMGLSYNVQQEYLQQFADAIGTTINDIGSYSNAFGDLILSELMGDVDTLTDAIENLSQHITDLFSTGKLSWTTIASIIDSEDARNMALLGTEVEDTLANNLNRIQQYVTDLGESYVGKYVGSSVAYSNFIKEYNSEHETSLDKVKIAGSSKTLADVTSYEQALELLYGADKDDATVQELIKLLEANVNATEKQILDALEEFYTKQTQEIIKDALDQRLDREITALEEQKSALEEINKQREYENKLIEAKLKLENAQKEKKRVWREGVGWVYESDTTAIASAQEEVDNLELEKQTNSLQTLIDELQAQRDWLGDYQSNLDFEASQQQLDQWSNNIKDMNLLLTKWSQIDTTIDTTSYTEKLESKTQTLVEKQSQSIEDALTALTKTSAYKAYNGDITDISTLSVSEIEDYNKKLKALEIAYSEATKLDDDTKTKLISGVTNAQKLRTIGQITSNQGATFGFTPRGQMGNVDASIKSFSGTVLSAEVGQDQILQYKHGLNTNMYVYDPYNNHWWSFWEWNEHKNFKSVDKAIESVKGHFILNSDASKIYWVDSNGKIYDTDTDTHNLSSSINMDNYNYGAIGAGSDKGVYGKFTSNATGTLDAAGGLSLVNDDSLYGIEGIITPNGTLTTLPSHSGVLPADITKSLWELGEVAPNLVRMVENKTSYLSKDFGTDESFNVDNLVVNMTATAGFDMDDFVAQLRTARQLTKNSH